MRALLPHKQRIVVKVGSSTITHASGTINLPRFNDLAWELVNLKNNGKDVVLVSSGAISCGARRLNMSERPRDSQGKQATSSVGQVVLMNMYQKCFQEYGYNAGQLLLTREIETDKVMQNHAHDTFEMLFTMNVIPVVNENDTISTEEIEFGDNDSLSAYVARLVGADLLILLSDIDGLYTDDPNLNPEAEFIDFVEDVNALDATIAKDSSSNQGTGGMITKLNAARLATSQGIDVVIANGDNIHAISDIMKGENIGTLFRGSQIAFKGN